MAAVVVAALAQGARADYDAPKWIQLPDVTPWGIDVNVSNGVAVGDDFLCTETGPITDIHIWGSWKNDWVPEPTGDFAPWFDVMIFADIPACQSGLGYSVPDVNNDPLWARTFGPGEYQAQLVNPNAPEGWFDALPGQPGCYEPDNHDQIWQYNFFIDPVEAFFQEGTPADPVVYWLAIAAGVAAPDNLVFGNSVEDGITLIEMPQFGWKTSVQHWNDGAVFGVYDDLAYYEMYYDYYAPIYGDNMDDWPIPNFPVKLVYPCDHPLAGQNIDMAFVITPEPATVGFVLAGLGAVAALRRKRQ